MGRIRTIKPEFPQSESVGRLSRDARLLFILLWTIADDYGRARANSRMLASLLYPYDEDALGLMEAWLSELERNGHIRRYEVDGDTYLDIPKWSKHQRVDKPSAAKYPEFRENSAIPRDNSRGLQESSSRTKEGKGGEGIKEKDTPSGAQAPRSGNLDANLYRLGKALLGKNSGGVITKLKQHCGGDLLQALELLQQAEGKGDPMEWLQAVMKPKNWRDRPEYAGVIVEGDA
jgi:hypothetical protein